MDERKAQSFVDTSHKHISINKIPFRKLFYITFTILFLFFSHFFGLNVISFFFYPLFSLPLIVIWLYRFPVHSVCTKLNSLLPKECFLLVYNFPLSHLCLTAISVSEWLFIDPSTFYLVAVYLPPLSISFFSFSLIFFHSNYSFFSLNFYFFSEK